ncbi:Auxin-responsive protein IAA33 [Apostasia shenzhenica]|uniref:Auxin-responsive protein n=1 Tax=Apostasia shenzhenica TaxID=1088818 RepID=A0A2I0A791_9ASPA|nr:Auxin-responsive protein IAA33 [Apostasia shenzhenica]
MAGPNPSPLPLKRRREETAAAVVNSPQSLPPKKRFLSISPPKNDTSAAAAAASQSITVCHDSRAISHRIRLDRLTGYKSLAASLHRLYVDVDPSPDDDLIDISSAVPGHLIAYEDVEDDLLLVGDISWKDFVRVVKRIRIIPEERSRWRSRKPPEDRSQKGMRGMRGDYHPSVL